MISYDQFGHLEGEAAERLAEIIDWRQALSDLPPSRQRVEAFEDLYREAEANGFAHFMASARFEQFTTLADGGASAEAARYYLQLLQVIARYRDDIHPQNRIYAYRTAPSFVRAVMETPDIPLEMVHTILDRLEQQVRADNGSMADVYLSRAMVASSLGDEAATLELLDRWQAEGDPHWSTADDGTVRIEIGVLEDINLATAIERQRVRMAAIDLDDTGLVYHRFVLASLLTQAGRLDEALPVMEGLTHEDGLAAEAPSGDHVRALEAIPDEAVRAAGWLLTMLDLDAPGEYPLVAAVARSILLADPADRDGLDLMRVAEWGAARLDRRNGTDAHRRRLAERWWTGLPPVGAPVDDEEASAILQRVVLDRHDQPVVDFDDGPFALRHRYSDLTSVHEVFSAPDVATAERLAAEVAEESDRLKFPTGRGYALWSLCVFHFTTGDRARGFALFAQLQDYVAEHGRLLAPGLVQSFAGGFALLFEQLIAAPQISLERLRAHLATQERIVTNLGLVTYPVAVAEAVLAAHLGDAEATRDFQAQAMQRAHDEDAPVAEVEVEVILTTARFSIGAAATLLTRLPEESVLADEDKARNFSVLREYFARRAGLAEDAARFAAEALASVDGDLDELDSNTPLAYFVSLLDASPQLEELIAPIEQVVRRGMPHTWESLAALAGVLLRRTPQDARGLKLLAEATAHAEALDRRNGTDSASSQMAALWF